MKKLFNLILVATIGATSVFGTINSVSFRPIEVYANTNEIKVSVNGKYITFDEQPILENGSVFVPMRAIFEALGYDVKWVPEFKTIEANMQKENYLISMALYGGNQMSLTYKEFREDYKVTNGRSDYRLPTDCSVNFTTTTTFSPNYKEINGRILVPVRAISEGTGANVKWDSKTQTVIIDSSNPIIKNSGVGKVYDVNGAKARVDEYFNSKPNTTTDVINTNNINNMAVQVLELVNIERTKVGVAPLILNKELSTVAQIKSDDMMKNNYFSHISPTYGSPAEMVTEFGLSYMSVGENIATGQVTAKEVVDAWMNSSGHKENILKANFTELGVGYSENNGRPIWVQLFIGK